MQKFFKAFVYAWNGIRHGFQTERNLKVHGCAATVVIVMGLLSRLSLMEWFIVLILIGGMLSLELVNAAIERVVDLTTTEWHPLAKHAKDLSAGAVLIYAIVSALIGMLLFIPKWFN